MLARGFKKRDGRRVSYSLREPEWEAVCECRYDEARDKMDRGDCPFHYDLVDDAPEAVRQHDRSFIIPALDPDELDRH